MIWILAALLAAVAFLYYERAVLEREVEVKQEQVERAQSVLKSTRDTLKRLEQDQRDTAIMFEEFRRKQRLAQQQRERADEKLSNVADDGCLDRRLPDGVYVEDLAANQK